MAGLLYVTMQPKASLSASAFHDWYNNEHGPLRLRLPFVPNGFRYRAADAATPEWLAFYDISDMSELTKETYLALRGDGIRTQREKDVMAQIDVGRKLYDFLSERKIDGYTPVDALPDPEAAGIVALSVTMTVKPEQEEDFNRWYEEEHISMLAKVPGWRRSARYVTAAIDSKAPREFLALHEFAAVNGLGGAEHKAACETAWRERIMANAVTGKTRRVYQWYYTFGPAPRELSTIATPETGRWSSNDGRTKTLPEPRAAVESFVTTPDGVDLPYRLEGSADDNSPVIVLSNSILVGWSVWDGFVEAFLSNPKNQGFRILRYLTRGRLENAGETPVTVDVLAGDIITLLDHLRIPKASLIGVSLGGVTVMNTALLYPNRIDKFISCDTNSSAPESNRKAWNDRIAIAEAEGTVSASGEKIVGEQLAEATTRRWFVDESYTTQPEIARHVKNVVVNNSLEGFRRAAQALCAYDVRDRMANASVPGLFVAGSGDGVLPQTMKKMAEDLKGDAELKVIDKAGHLPMVEQPGQFTEVVNAFIHA